MPVPSILLGTGITVTTPHHTTVLRPFFLDHPGKPMPEENFWTLWCKGRLTEADTQTFIRLSATPSGLTTAHLHHPSTRWTKKNPPLRPLLILQQCMGIFVRNFTWLLSDQIYTLSPSFIEIFLELTKLHSFNHNNPHFTRWKLCCLPR